MEKYTVNTGNIQEIYTNLPFKVGSTVRVDSELRSVDRIDASAGPPFIIIMTRTQENVKTEWTIEEQDNVDIHGDEVRVHGSDGTLKFAIRSFVFE